MVSVVTGTVDFVTSTGLTSAGFGPRAAATLDGVFSTGSFLDTAQQAVLSLLDGRSAAVLGAPGTGKTTTLVELVAERVLGRGYSPSEVLVLVPTRTGATTLRDTLALRIGVPSNGPLARTANSVAFQIVRDAHVAAGAPSPTLLTGGEQDQIIAELLQGHLDEGTGPAWPAQLGPEVRRLRGFRTELRDLMMRAVEYGVRPNSLFRLGTDHGRPEWVAAAEFIRGYEEVKDLARPGQYDSTELAQYAAALLRAAEPGPAGAATLGALAGLRLIVVDDAQESTQATLSLLAEFAARGVAVVAFGDPDISTGSFRGAHPDALGRLGEYLGVGGVQAFTLGSVYRHDAAVRRVVREATARIGTAAAGSQRFAVPAGAEPAGAVPASAEPAGAEPAGADRATRASPAEAATPARDRASELEAGFVQTVVTTTPADQLAVIARRLRERHVIGRIPWGQMAVIVRSGSLVPALAKGLAALEVPTQVAAVASALRDEYAVKAFILALDVTLGRRPLDGQAAVDLLGGPLGGLDPITLRRLRAALRQQELDGDGDRSADELLVEALTVPGALLMIETRTARRAAAFADSLRAASVDYRGGATIEELLWGLWQRSGLATSWLEQSRGTGIVADEANHNLDAVVALFSAAQRFVERTPDAPPVLFLEHLVDTDVPEDTLAPRAQAEAVVVSTPPGTIGQEFDVVVLAGVQENVWPDLRIRGSLLGAGDLATIAAGNQPRTIDARTAVLHDELRMFAQAASRSSRELLVTAVDNEDNQPSVFLRLLPEPDPAVVTRYPMSLRGMVGRLRRDLTGALRQNRATDAAATLARLAREGVPGADPVDWYGLREPSTTRPLNDPEAGDGPVRVSPSKMKSFESCPLHWVIGQIGGGTSNTAANLGTIIHKALENATTGVEGEIGDTSPAALWAAVDARWSELSFDADWQSQVLKTEARKLTDRLASYLADFERTGASLLSAEGEFKLEVGNAVLSGTIDRVERLPDGRAVIVDLKTGKGDPVNDAGVADHPQLGAYQLAFHDGAIDTVPTGAELAGARLVIVSSGTVKQNYRNPMQRAFTADELAAFRERVVADAAGMGGAVFLAEIADHCLDPWSFGSCRIHVIKQVSS
jgi:superfamily I DNA/RNA helicase/RecB family exonuclease